MSYSRVILLEDRPECQRTRSLRTETVARGNSAGYWKFRHVFFGLVVSTILSCALLVSNYLSAENSAVLVAFNFLFVSLTFPLNGPLTKKVFMLLACETVGLLWNKMLSMFASYYGKTVNVLCSFLNPFVNLIWIVTFYSITLTILEGSVRKG